MAHLPEKIFLITMVIYVGALIISPEFRDHMGCHLVFDQAACERVYPDIYDGFLKGE